MTLPDKLISRLIPPILVTLAQRMQYQITMRIASKSASYENSELCQVVAQKNLTLKNSTKIPCNSIEAALFLSSTSLLTANHQKAEYSVLDFGGGGGSHYFQYRNLRPDLKFEWNVIETAVMVKECKIIEDESIKFKTINEIKDAENQFDLLHSSCALQYAASPSSTLAYLLSLKPQVLCISRVLLSAKEEVRIFEITGMHGNGPGGVDKYKKKNVSYFSTAMTVSEFENQIATNYETLIKIDHGIPQAAIKASMNYAHLYSYVAVLNQNRTYISQSNH